MGGGVIAMQLHATVVQAAMGVFKLVMKWFMAPLWFFDAVDKEAMILAMPYGFRRQLLKIMFYPTLCWTIVLHNAMPDQRRWYDRLDERVIIGALPLRRQLEALARVERVTGVLNFCDEFEGHANYPRLGIRQLRLPTLDYCSPTAQQIENGLEFIRQQLPGCCTYIHCKAGRGRAGTMAIAYLIVEKGMAPGEAQKALSRVRPHVSPRLWKRATVREMYRRNKQRLLAKEMATHQQGLQQPVPLPQQLPPQKLFSG